VEDEKRIFCKLYWENWLSANAFVFLSEPDIFPEMFNQFPKFHQPNCKMTYTRKYCGVAPRGRSIERPLLINGYAYLAVSLLDNGQVGNNSYATEITDRCLGNRSTNRRPARNNGTIKRVEPTTEQLNR
jgi:hypothetical protein